MKKHIFAAAALGLTLGFAGVAPAMAAQTDTQSFISEISETGDTQSSEADSEGNRTSWADGETETQNLSETLSVDSQADTNDAETSPWDQEYTSADEEASSAEETSSAAATEAEDEDLEAASLEELNAAKKGWSYENGHWCFYENGAVKKGWLYVGRKWYFLQSDGRMVTGWQYLGWSGGKNWFYFDGNGAMKTGWRYLSWSGGKNWFFFNGSGAMKTGWQYLGWSGGKNWFYFNGSGTMLTGWQTINGKTYYLNSSGAMLTGTQTIDGKSYTFNSSGALASLNTGSNSSSASGTETTIDVSGLSEKEAFIKRVSTYVSKYASAYGIQVKSPIIAQAILESGWGKSGLSSKYHNYFGLKCGSKWTGKAVNTGLSKVYPAGSKNISSCWRVYDSMEEGVKGYFDFINTKRYQNLKGVTDPKTYLERIRSDGYSSSSSYVSSLMKIINTYHLTQYD